MDSMRKAAVLTRFLEELRKHDSRCGETHIQKASFFLQELMDIPTGFKFILYKHGPFSFDLREELTALRADGFVELEVNSYGPRIAPIAEQCKYVQKLYPGTLSRYEKKIEFIASKLGNKGVVDLEKWGTAYYVYHNRDMKTASVGERAQKMTELKPHISHEDAHVAVEEVDQVIKDAQPLLA